MLLKSHASLTCFWACFLPGPEKGLWAPRYKKWYCYSSACWYTAEVAEVSVAASEASLVAAGTAGYDFVATVVVAAD